MYVISLKTNSRHPRSLNHNKVRASFQHLQLHLPQSQNLLQLRVFILELFQIPPELTTAAAGLPTFTLDPHTKPHPCFRFIITIKKYRVISLSSVGPLLTESYGQSDCGTREGRQIILAD